MYPFPSHQRDLPVDYKSSKLRPVFSRSQTSLWFQRELNPMVAEWSSHGACPYLKDQNKNFRVFQSSYFWYLHPIHKLVCPATALSTRVLQAFLYHSRAIISTIPLRGSTMGSDHTIIVVRQHICPISSSGTSSPRFTILQEVFLSEVSSSAFSSKFPTFLSLHNELV